MDTLALVQLSAPFQFEQPVGATAGSSRGTDPGIMRGRVLGITVAVPEAVEVAEDTDDVVSFVLVDELVAEVDEEPMG